MYPIFNLYPHTTDPITIERQETRRPASRLEVIQRNRQIDRLHWMDIAETAEKAPRQHHAPGIVESIRRSLSRVLIQAGHRIDPQTA
jgi:hypothetical protein